MRMALARFKLRDGMILMAATAVGFGLARAVWMANEKMMGPDRGSDSLVQYWRFGALTTAICALVACLGPALLISSTLSDRRSLRTKLASPGFVPPFVMVLESLCEVIYYAPTWTWVATGHQSNEMGWIDARLIVYHVIGGRPGALIVAVWIIQWINGRFRPEPTWLDRAGRAIGIFWIAFPLVWLNIATFYFR